ncbi:histidine kinase [Pseudonocardia lacus]|uniref:histidine kinase n=1 Tax=Pseudonocardia lacus TaxID=2835865 RepID=UPI001BDBCEAB|nr:histidine kinase [Pseudonocardia lacus]
MRAWPVPALAVVGAALLVERRTAALRAELVEVRASRARIASAADDARREAERVLHDGAQQRLLSVALVLRMARAQLPGPGRGADLLEEAAAELAAALGELRELARGMYPVLLTDAGLGPALAALVERSTVPAELVEVPRRRLSRADEQACYFVVSDALALTAGALDRAPGGRVRIVVRDRGGRMDVEVTARVPGGVPEVPRAGLGGLEDRVAARGGTLRTTSSADGVGVRAVLPCG